MLWVCKDMKVYKGNQLCISALMLLMSLSDTIQTKLPWDIPQQNDAFLQLLLDTPPVGIHIFSQYDNVTEKVLDARGQSCAYNDAGGELVPCLFDIIDVSGGEIVTETGGNFNAVNPVTSLYGVKDMIWDLPESSGPYTTCWLARHDDAYNSDWNSICSTSSSSGVYVRDQKYVNGIAPMIDTNNANWVHSRYHWNQELNQTDMMIVTRALRKEIGG